MLDPHSHHHSSSSSELLQEGGSIEKPIIDTTVTLYSSIEQGVRSATVGMVNKKGACCSCCQDDNCTCGDNCQCSFIDGLKHGSNDVTPVSASTATNTGITSDHRSEKLSKDDDLKELLYFKLRAFLGIGLGFTAFALLALSPS